MRQRLSIDLASPRRLAIAIHRLPRAFQHQIVEERIARTGIEGDGIAFARQEGDVGDAADIQHGNGKLEMRRAGERAMIGRHQRCALPAGGHVSRPHVPHHRNAERSGERRAIADLHGEMTLRAMQHRLAMKADDIDMAFVETIGLEKVDHGGTMAIGDDGMGLRQHAGTCCAIGEPHRFIERGAQGAPFIVTIGERCTRPLAHVALAVGFDEGDVDTIHRCARHQADCSEPGHGILHQQDAEYLAGCLINWSRTGPPGHQTSRLALRQGGKKKAGDKLGLSPVSRLALPVCYAARPSSRPAAWSSNRPR